MYNRGNLYIFVHMLFIFLIKNIFFSILINQFFYILIYSKNMEMNLAV